MEISQILGYIGSGLSIIGMTISIIIACIKAKSNGNTTLVSELKSSIPALVIEAEQLFGRGNGLSKLQWVLTQLEIQALKQKTSIDRDKWTDEINKVVDATLKVNTDKKEG